ncbi:cytochrome C [Methylobacterium tarhaniae]|uniref:Cytochrome C n=1 Tax=Methylobacterium tarhaniae TaxID=1187852 RepID=A0A0J6TET7_9HYPH|nr:c-type cytochrome [Methylobacterium tarhaniae]KMO44183.1 cytochrome C [Methylobacterium tarhaniae]
MRRKAILLLAAVAALTAAGGGVLHRGAQARQRTDLARRLTGGEPDRAAGPMIAYGCAGCHEIPDLAGPRGRIGPPLRGLAERVYLGGVLPNTPDNLVRWIVDPKAASPRTAMPVTGISEAQARDVAAYLYARR